MPVTTDSTPGKHPEGVLYGDRTKELGGPAAVVIVRKQAGTHPIRGPLVRLDGG